MLSDINKIAVDDILGKHDQGVYDNLVHPTHASEPDNKLRFSVG